MDKAWKSSASPVAVIGAGLAGSEAAWQLARAGFSVRLYEMRPVKMTEAHQTARCAEMVCSNSFGSDSPGAASRILKEELEQLGAFILGVARRHAVPAGASLAVDRDAFAADVTEELSRLPNVEIVRGELVELPAERPCILATGPLTSARLASALERMLGGSLYFYDAIAPIVSTDSLDLDQLFFANRYAKGETADFLNVPLTKEQYETLVDDLLSAEVVLPHEFEEAKYFEGCMPIEAIAARGRQTLAFGPMKPVGLIDPRTGRRPYAVIQLRAENRHRTAYNLVGFQTKMKYGEQVRIFRKLPGFANAEFLRLGSMHRNTYLDSPRVLKPSLELRDYRGVYVAGQLTGTEGYLESSATGLVAARNVARQLEGRAPLRLPAGTMLGALLSAITDPTRTKFQPMNANIGILPPLVPAPKDRSERNARHAERSRESLRALLNGENTMSAFERSLCQL
jgi:methylenetetrahydrofolate--tRNA-(uracil-5-)-methyltransferase